MNGQAAFFMVAGKVEVKAVEQETGLEGRQNTASPISEEDDNPGCWSEMLIQSLAEGIITIDREGRITSFNHGAERISGWREAAARNQPVDRVFTLGEGQGRFSEHLPAMGGQNRLSVATPDGCNRTLSVSAAEMNLPGGTNQIILLLRDISAEEDSRQQHSYFLANISHEFRTPLAALNASVELILEEIADLSLEEIIELLNSIHYSVTNLQTLIDNLLESASIETGNFRIRRRSIDLDQIIAGAVQMLKPLLNRRRQYLEVHEPAGVPPVQVDPTRLTQVLVNLLSNASKFSSMDEKIDLTLARPTEKVLRVSVSDRGPGIPSGERANIFRRFVRLGQGESWYGVGLGLSVVKAIIEQHGGQVGLEDRQGGGSTFWFTLPIEGEGSGHESAGR
jgi:PAS domain S-box-containing protein